MAHTSTEQPEALANEYRSSMPKAVLHLWAQEAVSELRRLHARVQELEFRRDIASACFRNISTASQAQRVPLSDAQAWEVINATHNLEHFDPYEHNALFEVVRATESAHGITQEKQG